MSLRFQTVENWANLRLPLNVQKPKVLQFQGRKLCSLTRCFAPGPRWGLSPKTFIIYLGWRYRARHEPCLLMLRATTATAGVAKSLLDPSAAPPTCFRPAAVKFGWRAGLNRRAVENSAGGGANIYRRRRRRESAPLSQHSNKRCRR